MNKRIDLTNNGGFPLEQDTLAFMQDSYRSALGAMAKLCGNKTILDGVVVAGSNVTAGWIAVDGELIPFLAGTAGTRVIITESPAVVQSVFDDGASRDVFFTKTATCGIAGGFLFSELQALRTLLQVNTLLNQMKGIITYFRTDVIVGDIVNDTFINIYIPDQGTVNYVVGGSLVGYSSNPDADNDVAWMISAKTATSFKLCVKDINAPVNVQNLKFDFTITQAL